MPWEVVLAGTFGAIIVLLFAGIPVAVGLGLVGILSSLFLLGKMGVAQYAPWQVCNSFVLTALPLFVLMGEILLHSKLSERLYDGSTALVGWVPGSLLHANILSCAIFAAVSGSSVATAATIGTVAIPELRKRGFDTKLVLGSLAGGGTLGILIPPSVPLIIYGVLVEQSIGDLFIAGILPGIMLALIFMTYILIMVLINPQKAPRYENIPLKHRALKALSIWPIVVIMSVILGGIYFGIMTPTEAAAVAASTALIFGIAYRKLTWPKLQMCLLNTVKISTMVMFIIIGANIVAGTLNLLRVPDGLTAWIVNLNMPPLLILIFVYILYIFLGCFFDGISMMILTLPTIYPMIISLGYDPIWFGIALVILIEMAQITPPVGLNLYTIHGLRPDRPLSEVIAASMPFFFLMIVALAIITVFPSIATWLPSTIMHR